MVPSLDRNLVADTVPQPVRPANGPASQRGFSRFAWSVLGANLLVILWGAYVRASGSGAGCGEHWPLCNGEIVPRSPSLERLVEFAHRATGGIVTLLGVALLVWAWRAFPKTSLVPRMALFSFGFILTEGLIGAGLVLLGHTAKNTSGYRGLSLSLHLVNTLALVGSLALCAWFATVGRERGQADRKWLLIAALSLVVLTCASGGIAALGDTLFPAASLSEGWRADFSPTAHIFVRLRVLHPAIAVATALALGWFGLRLQRQAHAKLTALGQSLTLLAVAQLGAGMLNLALRAPVWMQLLHLLMADLVWICLAIAVAELWPLPATGQCQRDV